MTDQPASGEPRTEAGRQAAEWHRYLHEEGILLDDDGENCGPWHHRVFLGRSARAEVLDGTAKSQEARATPPALDVEALAQASTIIGLRMDIAYWRAVAAEYAKLIRDRFRPSEQPGADS